MRLFKIFSIVLLSGFLLYGQSSSTTGKIRGTVRDSETGMPLIGANVILKGTSAGSATNENGQFVIPNIPAGTYEVLATYMGYSTKNFTGLEVFPGQTYELNIELTLASILGETVEVVAEAKRKVVEVREAASVEKISAQEITTMAVSNVYDILANTAGIVETRGGNNQGIHVRGGRSGEVAYFVDGVIINDPVDNEASLDIDKYSMQSMQLKLSGMEAEYGDAMSGVVDIILREGDPDRISLNYRTEGDGVAGMLDKSLDFGYNKQYLSFGGPVPFTDRRLTYFLSGTYINTDTDDPSIVEISHNGKERFEGIGKFVYRPASSNFKLEISSDISREVRDRYLHRISSGNWLKSYYRDHSGHERISGKLSGTLSKNTAWSFLASYYHKYTKYSSGQGQKYDKFNYISTKLDWVEYAMDNGWYDPKTREWTELRNDKGNSSIRDSYILPDGTRLADADYETQAFYLYQANEGYYKILTGEWYDSEAEVEAKNSRYHNAGFYYTPSSLPEYSADYNPDDDEVKYREFDIDDYNDYLYMSENEQDENYLMGYNGDMHEGWAYDYDLFYVFRYGPGRPRYHDQGTNRKLAKFVLNSQWNMYNSVNTGFEISSTGMDYTDIQFANEKPYFDNYHVQPIKGAVWGQNKLEYEDLILNLGLRWDYFHSHSKALYDAENLDCGSDGLIDENEPGYDSETNPDPAGDNYDEVTNPDGTENDGDVDRKKATAKMKLSPRVGISFAVSDKSSIYANYSHFFQTPEYSDIFQNVMADFNTGYPLAGNPDIDPQETNYYEFGVMHSFNEQLGLKISAYYKDQTNLLTTRIFSTMYNGSYVKVTEVDPVDYATVKGLEIKLKLQDYKGINGEVSYEYLDAKGTGSSTSEFYYNYITSDEAPIPTKEYPLEFDIRHQLRTRLNYFIDKGVEIYGIKPFARTYTTISTLLRTGRPYTPEDSRGNMLEINSKRLPGYFNVNLRVEKHFSFFSLYVDVRNLFNIERVVDVYKYSGKADDPGVNPTFQSSSYSYYIGKTDPLTGEVFKTAQQAYNAHMKVWKKYYKTPANYGSPRVIRFGLGFFL